jgi:chromosome partitioning protein
MFNAHLAQFFAAAPTPRDGLPIIDFVNQILAALGATLVPGSGAEGSFMRVLALSSQKGGSGKTTLSGHLAVQAERAGYGPVCLIDIDPQGSLADWWNEREAEMPAFAQTTVARLASDLETLRGQGFKLAVIDTPPAITLAIQSVIQVAELIVIPTRPSPHDLRAVGATVDLCERAGKPLIFVVNAATPKAKITYEAAVALSQHGTVAPVTIHHRTDFAASMIDGRTVMEVDPKGRSAKEVEDLWAYMSDRLEKNFRRTVFSAPGGYGGHSIPQRPVAGFGRRVVGQ